MNSIQKRFRYGGGLYPIKKYGVPPCFFVFLQHPALHDQDGTRHGRQHRHHGRAAGRPDAHAVDLDGRAEDGRVVRARVLLRQRAVPAILLEALCAGVGHGRLGALEAARQHGAADAHRPVGVARAVGLRHHVPAVGDNGVALVQLVRHLERRHVGVELVGVVGQVDNQRRLARHVGRVAAEEDGLGVESQVEERVLAGHVGEAGAVGDLVNGSLVRGNRRRAVGPVVVGVGRRVDREDDVDLALLQEVRVVGDVLVVLATVHQRQSAVVGRWVALGVPSLERVGRPVGNVVVVVAKHSQDAGEDLDDEIGNALGYVLALVVLEIQHDLVEERTGGAHDIAGIVEANNARLVLGQRAVVELGADVLERHVTVESRVGRAQLPGVEVEDGRVARDDGLARRAAVCHKERKRRLRILKVRVFRNGGERKAGAAVGGIDELVREHAAPVVGDGPIKASILLVVGIVKDLVVIA